MWILATLDERHFLTENLRVTTNAKEAKQFESEAEAKAWYAGQPSKLRTPIHPVSL